METVQSTRATSKEAQIQQRKWVSASFLAVAALVWFLSQTGMFFLVSKFDLEAKFPHSEIWVRGLAILFAVIVFSTLYLKKSTRNFMHEVVAELAQVTWPAQSETLSATWIVLVMVLITAFIIGLFDKVWTEVVRLILSA